MALACALGFASVFAGTAASAWTTNLVQLDNGTCGLNLQIGSDKTASSSATPRFWLMGDGGLSRYDAFVDGVYLGQFNSAGNGNVCITTTTPLSQGAHLFTANEIAPRPSMLVTPFSFTVDTVAPSAPSVPLLSGYSDSGVAGDGVTRFRSINFTGTSEPLLSMQLANGAVGLGGAKADVTGRWSATTTSLADGTYFITAVSLDSAGNKSPLSSPVQITVDGTAPAAPAAPVLDPGSDSAPVGDNTTTDATPVVTGTAAGGVSKITVFADGVQVGAATPGGSGSWTYELSWLAAGAHTIQVKAGDVADNASALSPALSLTIGTATATSPGAPTLSSATAGNGSVALSWSAPSNGGSAITAYKVYRGTTSGGETLLTTLGTGTTWTDTSAANGTTYYYQVSAVNSIGEGSRSNERSATPAAPATAPGAPSLALVAGGNQLVNLSWNAPSSNGGSAITGYRVYRGTASGGATLLATVGVVTSYVDLSVANGTTYWYQVSALNSVGEGPRSSEWPATPVAPATAPGAPSLSSATAGNGSVALAWSAPSDGGSAITGYRIYRGTASGGETALTTVGTATGWTDTGVANGTTYYYQVAAINAVGEGSRSNERSATPAAPATVPAAPALNSATGGNGSVALSWSAPANGGSAITAYRVYRGTWSGGESLLATVGTGTTWTDANAANGTTYYYQVAAINSVGEGSRSNERSATPTAPATVPAAPTLNSATAGSGSVALSWSAPSDGGSAITAYRVYRGTSSGGGNLLATLGTGTGWTDTSAANGTTYYYQVAAVNSIGDGSRSNERSATPTAPATVPGAPSLSSATAGNGSVALSWSAPSDGGSAITAYRIYRGTASGGETVLATVGTGTSWTDTGAANGTTYYYQVAAINSVGEGSRSNERFATPTTAPTVPAAPSLNSATAGNGSVALSWSAPANGGSAITAYKVYRGSTSGGQSLLATLGTGTGWTDTSPANGTTYYYQVAAVNTVGEGSRSNERSATPTAPATVPAAPTLNSATAGNGSVALSWSAPSNGGSAITAYKVYRGTTSGGETLLTTLGTGTTWTDTSPANGTTYYYQVSAVNSIGEGSRSNERSATPAAPATVPAAPALNSATAGNGSVALSWSAPANGGSAITAYKVFRGTTSGNGTLLATLGTGTGWTDTSAANGVTHYYQVAAVNSIGEGSRSNERSATPTAPATVPAAPTLNSATAGNGSVALSWSAPANGGSAITAYKVYRGTTSGNGTLLATLGTGTGWTDTSAANGVTHYYQVAAVNSIGEGSRSNERSATPTAPATVPGAPTLNSATAAAGSVSLAWSAPSSDGGSAITSYRIYRGTASGGATLLTTSVGSGTTYTDTSVASGTTYYYQVSAMNPVGEGARSNERSATTPASSSDATAPSTPSNMTTLLSGSTQVVIDWTSSTDNVGVTGYQVYRDGALVATVPTSWFLDSDLAISSAHTYQVRAVDAAGNRSAASTTLGANTTGLGTGSTGTLSGVVFNANGTVISNAVARVVGTTKMTRTDSNGVWRFTGMQPGTYSVTITYTSSDTTTMTVVSKQTVIAATGLS